MKLSRKLWIKPGMLKYTTFQYYNETFVFNLCAPAILDCPWHLLLVPKLSALKPGEWLF